MIAVLTRNWWALALRGVFAILFGLAALAMPGISLKALIMLFGAYAVIDGLFAIVAGIRAVGQQQRWGPLVLEGIVDIAAGVAVFAWPALTALFLLYLVSVWAVVTGILEIAAALRLPRHVKGEWMLAVNGVISVLLGAFLIAPPHVGILAVVYWIGAYALIFGIMLLALGLRLRRLQHKAA